MFRRLFGPKKNPRKPFRISDLSEREVEELLVSTIDFAIYRLGNRMNSNADMNPEDLAIRAFTDTMGGTRNWNPETPTLPLLENHLRGCINSYISNYFGSKEWESKSGKFNPSDTPQTDKTPEDYFEEQESFSQRATQISQKIIATGDSLLMQFWELVLKHNFDPRKDREEMCVRLNLDPTTGGAGYQKFRRLHLKLKEITKICLELDPI